MSKAERKAYAKQIEQEYRDEAERTHIRAKLDKIGPFRSFLIKSAAPDELTKALDDWTGDLTGDRTFFWAGNGCTPKPRILLKHERNN